MGEKKHGDNSYSYCLRISVFRNGFFIERMGLKNMCDYKVLYQSEHGYVIRCNKCDCLKVVFGTTAISLTRKQMDEFTETIREYSEANTIDVYPNHKTIAIPTTAKSIQLLYSAEDLKKLLDLLEEAHLSIAIEQLF